MKHKVKFLSIALTGCFLAGCTCYNTHVPGRHIDHGENPGGIDRFFCNLDYILFPPEQGYVVAPAPAVIVQPPPPPAPVVVQPVVIPEYGYGWWQGVWVPRYQDWYWYHGTWVWGGSGMRPVPPAWAPDPKRPVPPPVVVTPPPPPVVVTPPPPRVVVTPPPRHHGRPAPVHKPAPVHRPAPVHKPAPTYKQRPSRQLTPATRTSNRGTQAPRPSGDNGDPRPVRSR